MHRPTIKSDGTRFVGTIVQTLVWRSNGCQVARYFLPWRFNLARAGGTIFTAFILEPFVFFSFGFPTAPPAIIRLHTRTHASETRQVAHGKRMFIMGVWTVASSGRLPTPSSCTQPRRNITTTLIAIGHVVLASAGARVPSTELLRVCLIFFSSSHVIRPVPNMSVCPTCAFHFFPDPF
jgi:hypothetical protein